METGFLVGERTLSISMCPIKNILLPQIDRNPVNSNRPKQLRPSMQTKKRAFNLCRKAPVCTKKIVNAYTIKKKKQQQPTYTLTAKKPSGEFNENDKYGGAIYRCSMGAMLILISLEKKLLHAVKKSTDSWR